ncbi:hypothetical protein CHS0354_033211 [Potamilus streckersoni]|uniref:RRM domain-containing protein n=1 Tax=Potamilus streckersoni TaxID=2493646 RepID=A0AAE0S743_9BIVA|nr:hypothetical protein CHS0354_033211 [Potamilus streckersoni]
MADVTVDTSNVDVTSNVESGTQDTDLIEPVTVEDATPSVQDQNQDEAMIVDDVVASESENAAKQIDDPPVTSTGGESDVEIVEDNTDLLKTEQQQQESETKTEAELEKEEEANEAGLEGEEFGIRLSKEEKRKRELEMNEIRAQREPLAQITVNIGPVMLDDLNTPSLREVLKSSSKYSVTFEMDTKKKNKERKTFELIGQIKIPYAFRSQRYLVKMYDLLSKLRIGNRDLSVSFPPEFVAVVEKSKKLIEELAKEARERRQMKKQLQIQANADAKKKSLYVHNLPTSVKEETLKAVFEECTNVVIPKTSEGMNMGFAVLEFKDVETAEKCYYGSKKKELEVHRRRIHLSRISVSGAPTDDEDGAKKASEPKNKPGSNQKEKEKDEPLSPSSKDHDDKDDKDDKDEEDKSEQQDEGLTPNQLRNRKRAQQRARARQNQRKGGSQGRNDRGRQNSQNQPEKRTRSQSGGGNRKRFRRGSFGQGGKDSQKQNQGGRNWGGGGNSRRNSLIGSTVDATAEIAFLKNKLAAMQEQLAQTGGHDRGYEAPSSSLDYGYYPSGGGGGSGGGYRGGSQQRGYGSNRSGGGYYGNRGASRSSSGRADIYSDYIKGLEKGGQQYPY